MREQETWQLESEFAEVEPKSSTRKSVIRRGFSVVGVCPNRSEPERKEAA